MPKMPNMNQKQRRIALLALGLGVLAGTLFVVMNRRSQAAEIQVLDHVEIPRILGSWYELAHLPNMFQKADWVGAQENYALNADGTIQVTYTYHEQRFDAEKKEMKAKMWRERADEPGGRFKYQLFWPLVADYLIIDVGPAYEYLVVGYPDRSMLWIMSRAPELPADVYQGILDRAREQGYDVSTLIRVPQPPGSQPLKAAAETAADSR